MKSPKFIKDLAEVVGHQTRTVIRKSTRTGNSYEAQVFDIEAMVLGAPEERVKVQDDGTEVRSYSYSVYDAVQDLGYTIVAPQKVDAKGFTKLIFREVTGGPTNVNGGYWFKASKVELPQKKEG